MSFGWGITKELESDFDDLAVVVVVVVVFLLLLLLLLLVVVQFVAFCNSHRPLSYHFL